MIEALIEKRLGAFELNASFRTGAGVTALFGRSGSGKSSIVKAIAGLLEPDRGRIRIGDTVLLDETTNVPAERRRIGVVFQDGRLFPHLTVEENLLYGFKRATGEKPVEPHGVIEMLGVGPLLKRRPATLSGGERQRVAVGRALLAQPRALLMDEPLASLDQARKRDVLPYLSALNARFQIPIVYVTHDADEVLELATDVVLLANGSVAAHGSLAEVTSRLDLPAEAEALGLGAVLDGVIEAHDEARGLTTIATAAGPFKLPLTPREIGAHIAIRIAAKDVALALTRPEAISVQNILPVTIDEVRPATAHAVRISLHARSGRLVAQVTADACARLNLRPGAAAFALIKSVALAR